MEGSSSKSWTAEDVRKNAATWSLEGDDKLLGFMQTISQNLEKRAVSTKENLNNLIFNLEHTSIALDNATNKLAALQHSQFVENRVQEDDEIKRNEKMNENSADKKEQQPYNPVDILKTIVKNSLTVLDECYEKVSVDIEDSDEEDEQSKSIIYRPKNPFDQRPLPHIIGTKEWKEKWHIGLCDSDEDYSDDNNDEKYSSDSELEEGDEEEHVSLTASIPSNALTVSESEISSTWGLQRNNIITKNLNKNQFLNSSDDEISSNTITSKNSSEDSRNHVIQQQTNVMNNIPIPDQRYYVHKPKDKNLFDESSSNESDNNNEGHDKRNNNNSSVFDKNTTVNNNTSIHQRIQSEIEKRNTNSLFNNRISNIINDEPPSDIDEVDKEKYDQQQYFIDNDIEYLPPATDKKTIHHKKKDNTDDKRNSLEQQNNNIRKKTVNLFDDDDFNSFMKELGKKNIEQVTKQETNNIRKSRNLFDEDDESDDNSSTITLSKNPLNESFQSKNVEINNYVLSKDTQNQIKNVHKKDEKEEISKTKIFNLFNDDNNFENNDDDDDFDIIFGRNKNNSKKIFENTEQLFNVTKKSSTITQSQPIENNLKNINDSKDLLENKIKSITNLFSEEPPDDDDLFSIQNKRLNNNQENVIPDKINILSDNISNKDAAITASSNNNNNNQSQNSNKIESSVNLFNDDENKEDNKQQTNKNDIENLKGSKTNSTLPNLFSDDNDDDDDDIFSKNLGSIENNNKNETTSNNKNTKNIKKLSANISNLFSDDDIDENDDDIFSTTKKSINNSNIDNNNTISTNKIGNTSNNSAEKLISESKQNNNITNTINSKISTLMDLFFDEPPTDDEVDDDLFKSKLSDKSISNNILPSNSNEDKNIDIQSSNISDSSAKTQNTNTNEENTKNDIQAIKIQLFSDKIFTDDDIFNSNSKLSEKSTDVINSNKLIKDKVPNNNLEDNKYLKTDGATFNDANINDNEKLHKEIVSSCGSTTNTDRETINEKQIVPETNDKKITNKTIENSLFDNKLSDNKISFIDDRYIDNIKTPNKLDKSINSSGGKLNYNPIGLFQDVPPEDDFHISNNDQKQRYNNSSNSSSSNNNNNNNNNNSNIFYDDFSETITSPPPELNTKTLSSSSTSSTLLLSSPNYNIFNDEPPPDLFDQEIDNTKKAEFKVSTIIENKNDELDDNSIKTKKGEMISSNPINVVCNVEKQQTVAELAKKVSSGTKDIKSSNSSVTLSPPKKLTRNLNINVAALLPGARRPLSNSIDENVKHEEIDTIPTLTTTHMKYTTNATDATDNKKDNSDSHNILSSLNKTRFKIPVKRRPSTRKARQENYRKSLTSDDGHFLITEQTQENVLNVKNSISTPAKNNDNILTSNQKENNTGFLNENSENLLFNKEKPFVKEIEKKTDPLLEKNEKSSQLPMQIDEKVLSNSGIDFFISGKSKNSSSLTTESFSSDDDLFGQKKITVLPSKKVDLKKSDPIIIAQAASIQSSPTNKIKPETVSTKSNANIRSIFQDDESDDDDNLFGAKIKADVKSKKYSKKNQTEERKRSINTNLPSLSLKKQSVFSSDDENDDDDLFSGKTLKNPISTSIGDSNKINKTEKVEKSKLLKLSTGKKVATLFDDSDLESDDDLFGSSSTKNKKNLDKTRNVPIPKKTDKKIISSGKSLSDNPLSDLLND